MNDDNVRMLGYEVELEKKFLQYIWIRRFSLGESFEFEKNESFGTMCDDAHEKAVSYCKFAGYNLLCY